MARVRQANRKNRTEDGERTERIALDRGYLTDGSALFHVERTIVDDPRGELLIEIEDCLTMELIVCAARSVAELGMRPVQPLTPYTV